LPETLKAPELVGRRLTLRPFTVSHISDAYLSWLNDPEVNRYSRRRHQNSQRADAIRFLESLAAEEWVLGIHLNEDNRHIGNIQLGPINRHSHHAEIRILIGDRNVWGKGYGTEAVYLASRYLLQDLKLHRVEANTCNPAFLRSVEKLGWRLEGRLRERFLLDGAYHDYLWLSLLQSEFKTLADYEAR